MTIRLYDKFDYNFTLNIYDGVKGIYNNIIEFENGDEIEINPEFEEVEIIEK